MAQVSFRIDEDVKQRAERALEEMGLTMSAAITVFLTKVARERRIPFEIKAPTKQERNEKAWNAFMQLREQAKDAGIQDLTLDEINEIISEVRHGK